MKITFVVPALNMSGGLRVVSIYAKLLSEKGHTLTIVSPKEKIPSLKQRIKHTLKWKGYQFKSGFDTTYFENVNYDIVVTNKLESVLAKDVPDGDVVIATWWLTAEWLNKLPESKGRKVYFIQGHDAYDNLQKEKVEQTYYFPFYKITIANWLVSIMKVGYQSKQVDLVPNSVDLNLFAGVERVKPKRPTIGFLFSEAKCKGVSDSLKVLERLKNKLPNLRIIAFGVQAPEEIALPEYIELSINPKQTEINNIYQQCDLWLCCSLSEGFGLTLLEAMACRAPCVSTKCGGPEDIVVEGVNGFLCEVGDIDALAVASYKILTCNELTWKEYSNQAYKQANTYTWNDAADLFEASLLKSVK